MTQPRRTLADLPDWPRWMDARTAADYVGAGYTRFMREVERGIWPQPDLGRGRPARWDRKLLDLASDRRSALDSANPPHRTAADAMAKA